MGWLRLLGVVLALVCTGLVLLAFATRERRYLNHAILLAKTGLVAFLLMVVYFAVARLLDGP